MNTRPRTPASCCRFLAVVVLAGMLALASLAVPAQDIGRIGYVDMKRLIDQAPQMQAARERLRTEFDARDAELKVEVAKLAELDARLRDEAATLPAADLATLQRQAETLRRSIDRTRQRLQQELAARSDEEIERTWPLIDEAVADYAREAGLDLVVQSPQVFVSGRIDITERVLERLRRNTAQADPP